MKPILESGCLFCPTTNLWGVKVGSEIKEYPQPGADQNQTFQEFLARYSESYQTETIER